MEYNIIEETYSVSNIEKMVVMTNEQEFESQGIKFIGRMAGPRWPIYHIGHSSASPVFTRGQIRITGTEDSIRESKKIIEEKIGAELIKL